MTVQSLFSGFILVVSGEDVDVYHVFASLYVLEESLKFQSYQKLQTFPLYLRNQEEIGLNNLAGL